MNEIYKIQGQVYKIKESKTEKIKRVQRMQKRISILEINELKHRNKENTAFHMNESAYNRIKINRKIEQIELILKQL